MQDSNLPPPYYAGDAPPRPQVPDMSAFGDVPPLPPNNFSSLPNAQNPFTPIWETNTPSLPSIPPPPTSSFQEFQSTATITATDFNGQNSLQHQPQSLYPQEHWMIPPVVSNPVPPAPPMNEFMPIGETNIPTLNSFTAPRTLNSFAQSQDSFIPHQLYQPSQESAPMQYNSCRLPAVQQQTQHSSLPSLPPLPRSSHPQKITQEKSYQPPPEPEQPARISVIRLDKPEKKEKLPSWSSKPKYDENELADDPRLVKVQDHRETIAKIHCAALTEPKIHFINLPPPIVSPMSFVLPFNSGKQTEYPMDFPHIVKNCLQTRIPFVDASFPSHPLHSKYNDVSVTWRRIKDFEPDAIFAGANGPAASDILQGGCSDSPFLIALSAISTNSKLMKQIAPVQDWNRSSVNPEEEETIIDGEKYPMNVFRFWFWKWDKWIEVIVDDRIPLIGSSLAFASCRNPSIFWLPLLEKAYAKLHGSYQAIEQCRIEDVILDLTGGSCEELNLRYGLPQRDKLWEDLNSAVKEKFFLFASIHSEERQTSKEIHVQPNGLLIGRPYHITGLLNLSLSKKSEASYFLVRINALWEGLEWKGAWGPNSKEICGFSAKELQKKGLVFGKQESWISFDDLVQQFTSIWIAKPQCYLEKKKHFQTMLPTKSGGCPSFPSWPKNAQYLLTVSHSTETLNISVLQQDWKIFSRDTQTSYKPIGITVFKVEDNRTVKLHRIAEIVTISEFVNRRESATHVTLTKGRYIIIPSTYKAKKKTNLLFRVWAQSAPVSCKEIKREAPKKGLFQSRATGVFTIEIVKAKGLTKVGLLSCDPFAEVSVEGTTKKTRNGKDGEEPEWGQQFIFFVKKPGKAKVKITIWHDGVLLTTFMGMATFNISDLLGQVNGATYRCSLPLQARKKDEKQGKEVSGFVVLRMNYFGNVNAC